MHPVAMRPPSEPALRAAFVSLAVVHLALGTWMFFSPHTFFTTIGAFEHYNPHYERDAATFYFAFALGSGLAAWHPYWRVPVLAMITLQYAIHTLNHVLDVDRANNEWAGPVDAVSLGLAALQFAGLLWLLTRGRPAEARA